ncbi:MAG: fructosamine kinase family protein [Lachnospiraceae bacterium]|nr:fructosamine kinase family protein [Lachnospiraceae bacterium]
MDHLLCHLDQYLIEPDHPSLVHGDMWTGNVMTGEDGTAWLIDPAVYVGNAEVDLAMSELFGGFPQSFYPAYRQYGKVDSGYSDRRDLYNLYHLSCVFYLY